MRPKDIIIMIIVAFICTIFLRALPFIVFSGKRKMPEFLKRLGDMLPPTIIAVLVVYCLKSIVAAPTNGESIAMIIASVVVFVTYKWKHNTLISIALGTIVNMLLIYLL